MGANPQCTNKTDKIVPKRSALFVPISLFFGARLARDFFSLFAAVNPSLIRLLQEFFALIFHVK